MAAQNLLSNPPIREAVQDADGNISRSWLAWFAQVQRILFPAQQSGTTANRPTTNLWAGRFYFDVSLGANGMPIWVRKDGAGWVKADGTAA